MAGVCNIAVKEDDLKETLEFLAERLELETGSLQIDSRQIYCAVHELPSVRHSKLGLTLVRGLPNTH